MTDAPLLFPRMAPNIALTRLASGRTVRIGAEYRRGVHEGFSSLGVAGKHAKKEYLWTPIFVTSTPHHG